MTDDRALIPFPMGTTGALARLEDVAGRARDYARSSKAANTLRAYRSDWADVTRWKVRGPMGQMLEWTSRQTAEQPGRKLSWQSLPGGSIATRGSVEFRPAPANTIRYIIYVRRACVES